MIPPDSDLKKAALLLWEWNMRLDQPLDALVILTALPYTLDDDADVKQARAATTASLSHLATPEAYAKFYRGIWEADLPPSITRTDIMVAGERHERYRWAVAQAQSIRAHRALDLGSGDGLLALYLACHGIQTWAVNLTARVVLGLNAIASNLLLPATFRAGAAEEFSGEGEFDLVTAFEIVEHVAIPDRLLRAMEENCRPGGLCLLTTPNGSTTYGEDTWAVRDRNGGKLGDPLAHVRVYTWDRITRWLGPGRPTLRVEIQAGPGQGSLAVAWRPGNDSSSEGR